MPPTERARARETSTSSAATSTSAHSESTGVTGNSGDEMVEPHDERDDEEQLTDGHEELFAVMSGHAVFTVDGHDIDAPAGTLVFVRNPSLTRSVKAVADDTSILAVGASPGRQYEISRWERAWFPDADR